jgi:SP family sugar:H+ symporter-like MFS transporter
MSAGSLQWKVPLGIQIVPGGILVLGIPFMPESLRWLAINGKDEQCRKTIAKLYDVAEDDPIVTQEMDEIERAVEIERQSRSGKIGEIFQRGNLRRLFIGCMLQLFQQWTGTNAIVCFLLIQLCLTPTLSACTLRLHSISSFSRTTMLLKSSTPLV